MVYSPAPTQTTCTAYNVMFPNSYFIKLKVCFGCLYFPFQSIIVFSNKLLSVLNSSSRIEVVYVLHDSLTPTFWQT